MSPGRDAAAIDATQETAAETRGKWLALLAAFLGWTFDGVEIGLFPLAARPALIELLGPERPGAVIPWIVTITAAFLVGCACGGLLFGWLGDRIGRVRTMLWSVLTYSIFSGLCCLAEAPWHLGALRFAAALGMGGEWSVGVALVMEIWPAKSRPLLAGLIGAAANVGNLLVGLLALALSRPGLLAGLGSTFGGVLPARWFGDSSWRLLLFCGALPAVLTVFIRFFVPESERWKKATRDGPKPRLVEIFDGGMARTSLLGAGLAGVALLGTWGSMQQAIPWTAKIASELAAQAPHLGINPRAETAWTQISLSVAAIIGTLAAALLAEKLNRRRAYFGLCIASLLVCQILFRATAGYGWTFLIVAGMASAITAGFYGWLPLYLPELFPTRVRAMGQGFSFNCGRILAAAGVITVGFRYGGAEDYPRMCAVTSLVYLFGLLIIWLGPETKGRPLPA